FLAAFVAAFAVFAFFPARFVFNVASFVVVLSVVATSVLIVISFLAVDPPLTIHHSGWPGKRVERSEERIAVCSRGRSGGFHVYENAVIRPLAAQQCQSWHGVSLTECINRIRLKLRGVLFQNLGI